MELANSVIQYLHSTRYLAIRFGPNSIPFHAASDAAFADNPDRKSTEAYLFKLYEMDSDNQHDRKRPHQTAQPGKAQRVYTTTRSY